MCWGIVFAHVAGIFSSLMFCMWVWCIWKRKKKSVSLFSKLMYSVYLSGTEHFHINCYNFFFTLITCRHSSGLKDDPSIKIGLHIKVRHFIFSTPFFFFFLVMRSLQAPGVCKHFPQHFKFCFHSCWSVFFTTICQLHLFDFWSILIKRLSF